MQRNRRSILVWSASALTLTLVSACSPRATTSGTGSPQATMTSSAPESSRPQVTVPAAAAPTTVTTDPSPQASDPAEAPSTTESTTTTSSSSTSVPAASVVVSPAHRADDVSPIAPLSVKAATGTLQSVTLTNAAGTKIAGTLAGDRRSWSLTPELGYGKTYTLAVKAVNDAGAVTTKTSSFTTTVPDNQTAVSTFPIDATTVGVGQPVSVMFDEPITDRAAAQKLITVTTTPKQEGSFRWFSDKEVHWRPKVYWQSGSKVSVSVKIYGQDLGGGLYGQRDKEFAFTVGRSMIAEIDDKTKTMVVKENGKVVKTMPVSLGRNQYPTYNGVHVVAEKYAEKTMDSSTWGLTGVGAYVTDVKWATRISSTGEFVHAAPWSVASQGVENVSHGCVNVSTENAKWFYDNFTRGDIVSIKNTVGTPLQSWDGYGDWQLSYADYRQGSAT